MVAPKGRMFASERKEHFAKKMHKFSVEEGRRKRDAETRRMEEYRRLCKKDGIVSQRLQEYDDAKQQNSAALDQALQEVEASEGMTNAQKRRRKYALKRKAAAQPTVMKKLRVEGNPMHKAERIRRQREEARQKKIDEAIERRKEKETKVASRQDAKRLYRMKTSKGQPVMSSRIECLLKKL